MSGWAPAKYKAKNWSIYNDSLKRRGSLSIWFDPQMVWIPPPTGKRGRRQQFSDAAIQACLTLKVLFGMPLRQTTGFVESLPKLVGLSWDVPDFSTLCRRQKTLNVNLPYRGGTGPLNLLIDSTGIKAGGKGEWNAHAVIPPRKNAKPWKPASSGAIARNQAVEASRYLGQRPPLTHSANVLPGGAWCGPSTGRSRRSKSASPCYSMSRLIAFAWFPERVMLCKRCLGETAKCTHPIDRDML